MFSRFVHSVALQSYNSVVAFQVWRFLISFSDVLDLWPFTLDEFIQAFHDYVSLSLVLSLRSPCFYSCSIVISFIHFFFLFI